MVVLKDYLKFLKLLTISLKKIVECTVLFWIFAKPLTRFFRFGENLQNLNRDPT